MKCKIEQNNASYLPLSYGWIVAWDWYHFMLVDVDNFVQKNRQREWISVISCERTM